MVGEGGRMNILVTGGAGYVGSVLVPELLREGYDITVLDSLLYGATGLAGVWDHPRFTFIQGDIRDEEVVHDALWGMGPESVVHLAALRHVDCDEGGKAVQEVNVNATINLVRQSRECEVKRFIFASSCSVYGITSGLVDEESYPNPLTIYADSKFAAERSLWVYSSRSFCTTVLRFATAYGVSPNMRWDLLPNQFVYEALNAKRLSLYNPNAYRSFIHVRDWTRAVAMFLKLKPRRINKKVFNVGGECKTKLELAQSLEMYERELEISCEDGDRKSRDYRVSFEKARKLGFRPKYSVDFGIFLLCHALNQGVL
jgi:nucleoside-diphosphate-sugar epimerase